MTSKNTSSRDGKLVVFEGPNGSGTTTHWLLAAKYLIEKGVSIITTREPGGTKYGEERLREDLLNPKSDWGDFSSLVECFIFSASRAHNVKQRIIPALNQGKIVLCDRFALSSLVFQGYAGNKSLVDDIKKINSIATCGVEPHLRIILNIDYKKAQNRLEQISEEREEEDKFEKKKQKFKQDVSEAYKELTKELPNTVGFDSTRPKEVNAKDIKKELQRLISSLGS